MTQANDSILVTPGSGATVATHLANSKEYQVIMPACDSGHILGTKETYLVQTGNSANVAAAATVIFDLFNATASGKVITVTGIYIIPTLTAVVGIGLTFLIERTTSVGTGGSTLTPRPYDATHSISASVTARSKATGGAAAGVTLWTANTSSEETTPYAGMASTLNHLPGASFYGQQVPGIVMAENTGLRISQTTNSSIGSTNILVLFTSK